MKLVMEIGDYEKTGVSKPWVLSHIEPIDKRDGISVRDKSSQTAKLARLIDLSEVLKQKIEEFYQNMISSPPNAPMKTSGEP